MNLDDDSSKNLIENDSATKKSFGMENIEEKML